VALIPPTTAQSGIDDTLIFHLGVSLLHCGVVVE